MLLTTIHFSGNCNEAISFYRKVLSAEVKDIAYFKDAPENSGLEAGALPPDFVMHSLVSIEGALLSMTDGSETPPSGTNYSFLITKNTADEVSALFDKLSVGGKVIEALSPVFWASMYAMVEDRFGVTWQIMTAEGMQGLK